MGVEDNSRSARRKSEDLRRVEDGRKERLDDLAAKIGTTPAQLRMLKYTTTDVSGDEKKEVVEGQIGDDIVRIERTFHYLGEGPDAGVDWDFTDELFMHGEKVDLNSGGKYNFDAVDWIMEHVYECNLVNSDAKDAAMDILDRKD